MSLYGFTHRDVIRQTSAGFVVARTLYYPRSTFPACLIWSGFHPTEAEALEDAEQRMQASRALSLQRRAAEGQHFLSMKDLIDLPGASR